MCNPLKTTQPNDANDSPTPHLLVYANLLIIFLFLKLFLPFRIVKRMIPSRDNLQGRRHSNVPAILHPVAR